jgi:transporter family-2 protein
MHSANTAALVSFLVGPVRAAGAAGSDAPTDAGPRYARRRAAVGVVRGLFGAFYVAISTVVRTELGAASLLALALLGQLTMALLVDHYGWLGLP